MSKRLRKEEEKLKQIKEDEDDTVDKLAEQMRKIYAPLVWQRTATGFRIEDVKEKHFSEVTELFKEHYIPNEVLCKNTELKDDEISVNAYVERLIFILKDMTSIMAIDENYKEDVGEKEEEDENKKNKKKKPEDEKVKIAGVLVMRVVNKMDYGRVFSRIQLIQGDALKKCVHLRSHINRKVDVYAKFNCDSFLRYYDLCILPEYRHKGLGFHMLKCGVDVARAINVPVLMGVFSNFVLQKLAKKLNMQVLYEVNYVEWRDSEGEMIFDDPGAGNYTCALMAGPVPPPPPPPPPKPKEEDVGKKAKVTRVEKKAAAAKKGK